MNSSNIQYTYHRHVDGNGVEITSSTTSSTSGGCLTHGYHSHNSNCKNSCTITKSVGYTSNETGVTTYHIVEKHSSCGQATSTYSTTNKDTGTSTHEYYVCGNSPVNTYKIGCGKTESSIESATITFE